MPPRSSYAFLAAGPIMLAIAAFLALPGAEPANAADQVAVLQTVAEL